MLSRDILGRIARTCCSERGSHGNNKSLDTISAPNPHGVGTAHRYGEAVLAFGWSVAIRKGVFRTPSECHHLVGNARQDKADEPIPRH